jgi:MFS superfamily sulfate permease-like transporter
VGVTAEAAADTTGGVCGVMAVQAEVPWELNSDHEITAVGVGNLLAGLFAGGGPGTIHLCSHIHVSCDARELLAGVLGIQSVASGIARCCACSF